MTNFENLSNEDKYLCMTTPCWGVSKETDKVFECNSCASCNFCKFFSDNCYGSKSRRKWLNSEVVTEKSVKYQIPVNTLVDSKCLVSDDNEHWKRRYFSGKFSSDGTALMFDSGRTSWSCYTDRDDLDCSLSFWKYVKIVND